MPDCAACGKPLEAGAGFCRHCGTVVPEGAGDAGIERTTVEPGGAGEQTGSAPACGGTDAGETTMESPPAGEQSGPWSCPACGAAAGAGDLFCSHCGTARPREAAAGCASCGASLAPGMEFCPQCGARRGRHECAAAPPPAPPRTTAASGGRGGRTAIIVIGCIVLLAAIGVGVYFGFFYGNGGKEEATRKVDPIIGSIIPTQKEFEKALRSLALDAESFTSLAEAAQALVDVLKQAQVDADAIVVDAPAAEEIVTTFQTALSAHTDLATALTELPADPMEITQEQIDALLADAEHAIAAYGELETLDPSLPAMPFPTAATDQLTTVADQIEAVLGENSTLLGFLENLEALFSSSQAERLAAEDVVAQLEATEIPPDNAAGQMAAQAVRLRSIVGEIEAITPPADQRAEQVKATYRAAVAHWVTAARQYAKWMRHLQDYYEVSGDWPPAYGIEADTYLDPAYDAARQAQDLATEARETLASEIDRLAGTVGGTTGFTADDM